MSDSLKWTKCCKGRQCPEIALEGDNVHIKDDYGNQVVVDRGNIPFFDDPAEPPDDLNRPVLRIHGKESGKPPVRMSLFQFYELLSTLDSLPEVEETLPVEKAPQVEAVATEEKKPTTKKTGKKKKKVIEEKKPTTKKKKSKAKKKKKRKKE